MVGLTAEERDGLTMWGTAISAQVRGQGELVLHVRDDAPRSGEDGHPVRVPAEDVSKLADLLNEARRRGLILGRPTGIAASFL